MKGKKKITIEFDADQLEAVGMAIDYAAIWFDEYGCRNNEEDVLRDLCKEIRRQVPSEVLGPDWVTELSES